jgi:hypothetical protein
MSVCYTPWSELYSVSYLVMNLSEVVHMQMHLWYNLEIKAKCKTTRKIMCCMELYLHSSIHFRSKEKSGHRSPAGARHQDGQTDRQSQCDLDIGCPVGQLFLRVPSVGNRSSFRNVLFLVISNTDDGQSPKIQYLCVLYIIVRTLQYLCWYQVKFPIVLHRNLTGNIASYKKNFVHLTGSFETKLYSTLVIFLLLKLF